MDKRCFYFVWVSRKIEGTESESHVCDCTGIDLFFLISEQKKYRSEQKYNGVSLNHFEHFFRK